MARRGPGGAARAAQVRPACPQPDDVPPGSPGSTPLLLVDRAVVVVLQSRALVGARWCHRVDGCCRLDDIAPDSPIYCGRNGLHPADVRHTSARPRPCRRRGRLPSSRDTAVGVDDRDDRCRPRSVHAVADRRRDGRSRVAASLALDADCRGTAVGTNERRPQAASAGRDRCRNIQ
jgi:hypothetical protein